MYYYRIMQPILDAEGGRDYMRRYYRRSSGEVGRRWNGEVGYMGSYGVRMEDGSKIQLDISSTHLILPSVSPPHSNVVAP